MASRICVTSFMRSWRAGAVFVVLLSKADYSIWRKGVDCGRADVFGGMPETVTRTVAPRAGEIQSAVAAALCRRSPYRCGKVSRGVSSAATGLKEPLPHGRGSVGKGPLVQVEEEDLRGLGC